MGGGGGCCCCRRVIPPPLPCLVLSGATSCSLRGGSAGRCRRSAPRSAARTAAPLDFGQINFQVWERSGSYGSSSYSPPPPPPPVRRCRGCRRGCPQPRSPIRSPPPPSLSLRTLFPSSGFSPRPPLFFVKVRGVGRDFPPRHPPLSPLIALQVAGEPGRASPAPSRRLASLPPCPSPGEAGGPSAAQQLRLPGLRHKLPLPMAVPARLPLGRGGSGARPARSHGSQPPLGCTPPSPIAAAPRRAGARSARTVLSGGSALGMCAFGAGGLLQRLLRSPLPFCFHFFFLFKIC